MNNKKNVRDVVWIFFAKPNGFAKKFQTLYIVNLDEFCESYGKNNKRSLYQKVDLFIFIIEYFINSWQN